MNSIQKVIYEIYQDVAKILIEHGIDYYAVGGTCLGAVRHKGFIPWDDDIDIAIKIEDFENALELLESNLPNRYSVRFFPKHKHYTIMHAKVINEETTFIEESEYRYKDAYKGCFIDIMPLSGVPRNKVIRYFFCKRINIYRVLNQIRRWDIETVDTKTKQFAYPVVRAFDFIIPEDYFSRKWYHLLKKYPFDENRYTGYVWWYEIERLIYKKEVFGQPKALEFEGSFMYCPEDCDTLLSQQFGDYMKLPPEDKRYGHYVGTIDLEHSYHDYVMGKYPLHMEK